MPKHSPSQKRPGELLRQKNSESLRWEPDKTMAHYPDHNVFEKAAVLRKPWPRRFCGSVASDEVEGENIDCLQR